MKKLTSNQRSTYNFIKAYTLANGYPPTLREIADVEKITIPAAKNRLEAIAKKGHLELTPNISRGIKVVIQ